jgi:uncharacterized protein YndB with AHSA1/START domain
MFKIIIIAITLLIAAVLIYAATQPDMFRVERSLSIKASPEGIFPYINDLHQHALWSPWEKKDPAMKRAHSGAPSGVGAVYEWEGNREIGQGRMEIVESSPPSGVVMTMHFIKPFEARNTVEFTLNPTGDSTLVTWAIHGPRPYMAKVVHLVIDVNKMIGKEFESGLSSLKMLAEQ